MLLAALDRPGTTWREEIGVSGVRVFIDEAPSRRPLIPIEVDLTYTLGRKLRLSPRAD